MALSVLQLLSTIFPSSPPQSSATGASISVIYEFPSEISINQVRRLVYCLRDSYDANRTLVIDLLCNLPQERVRLMVKTVMHVCKFRAMIRLVTGF